jgi:predicted ATPase
MRPELLRIRGEIYKKSGRSIDAETGFEDAFVLAEAQGALAWMLRAAMSCSKLRPNDVEKRERLAGVVGSFREGFDTEDIRKAKGLLQEICSPETYNSQTEA